MSFPPFSPIELTSTDFSAAKQLDFQLHVVPKLKQHCFDCHGESASNGNLNLSELISRRPIVAKLGEWRNVIQQVKLRSMPPPDSQSAADAMQDADRKLIAAWLTNELDHFDYASVRAPGHEPARRLTRDEYNHTIRDLVGIDLRPADRFPADMTASSGFRNSANSLHFQPITLERFVWGGRIGGRSGFP